MRAAPWRRSGAWAVSIAVSLGLAGQAGATFPGASGLLAFQSDRAADYGIWISNPDGSNPRVLYDPLGTDEFNPAWSPNGMQVVLQSGPLDGSTSDLVLVDVVSGVATPLLVGPENDRAPQFCDSDTVVFSRQYDPANADLFSIRTDGSGLVQLTDAAGADTFPTCSPDGGRIAFNSNRGGPQAIWEVDRDGSNPRVLVPAVAVDPDYAPDGSALAYAAPDPADGNPEIFLLDLSTGNVAQRTQTGPGTQNRLPRFAPSYGVGVIPAGPGPVEPPPANPAVWLFHTHLDAGLEFPELNLGLQGIPTVNNVIFCGDPAPGPPGVPPNPPPGDPGGPKNNSAVAAQPAASCALNSVGTLTIEGTEGPDRIYVGTSSDGGIRAVVNGQLTTFRAGIVTGIRILAGGGNDEVETVDPVPVRVDVDGGPGINMVQRQVTLVGSGARVDRAAVKTTRLERGYIDTEITFNGETATFLIRASVSVEGFDSNDTVVVDEESNVQIGDWLSSHPILGMFESEGHVLTVEGTAESDRFTIKVDKDGPLRISRNGEAAPAIAGRIGEIRVLGGGGADRVETNVPVTRGDPERLSLAVLGELLPPEDGGLVPVTIDAGAGNDRVTCRGKGATCTVKAGAGNDRIDVRDGTRSVVNGGPGRDRVRADRGDRVRKAEIVIRGRVL